MKPEAQRIAIAEACGWKGPDSPEVREITQSWTTRSTHRHFLSPAGDIVGLASVPDYLNDLNAMQDAVCGILNVGSAQMNWDYAAHLGRITESGKHISTALIQASAAQRAEALLRTLEKYIESQ